MTNDTLTLIDQLIALADRAVDGPSAYDIVMDLTDSPHNEHPSIRYQHLLDDASNIIIRDMGVTPADESWDAVLDQILDDMDDLEENCNE